MTQVIDAEHHVVRMKSGKPAATSVAPRSGNRGGHASVRADDPYIDRHWLVVDPACVTRP